MSEHENAQGGGDIPPPNHTLVTISTIAIIMETTRRVLNQLDGLGISNVNNDEVSMDDTIARLVYEGLQTRHNGGLDV